MKSFEHRSVGDAATGGALVNVGSESPGDEFLLSFGDVVAMAGDFFSPSRLFGLARTAGASGTRLDTRDEIVCALKVSTLDEAATDTRFEPGGRFADFRFSLGANRSDVERRVRDGYLTLAASNDDHFVMPGRSDAVTGSGFPSARSAYRHFHQVALAEAWRLGCRRGDMSQAMAREAAAQHYLTDAFAAGHVRTPVASIRRYWKARYPSFWEYLQRKVASDTAAALRQLSLLIRLLPRRFVYRRTYLELTARTSQYPELSVGDLVARAFHDWDNAHGLTLDGGAVIFGDGHIDEGATREIALSAVRAGNDDVEVAFGLGRSGKSLDGESLYAQVRHETGAAGEAFRPEEHIPQLAPDNPVQNWRVSDVEALWDSPMVGATGKTVGEALVAMLEPGEQFIRQVEGLGEGLAGGHGVFAVPLLGAWLTKKCCQAYHDGFVEPLSNHPEQMIRAVVGKRSEATCGDEHVLRPRRADGDLAYGARPSMSR